MSVDMKYEVINGPMYCDFENFQKGIEEDQEGDEWFDKRVDEMEADSEGGLSAPIQEAVPVTNEEPGKESQQIPPTTTTAPSNPGTTTLEEKRRIASKLFKALGDNNKENKKKIVLGTKKQQKVLPGRNAALKATVSITAMYKPKAATSTTSSNIGCTVPTTPKFIKRYQSRLTPKNTKTSEDLELEKIEQLKWEIKQKKDLSKQSFKRMKQGTPTRTRLATKTTEPVGFNFRTDARLKPSREGTRTTVSTEDKFPMNLRSSHKNDYNPNDPLDRKMATPREPTHVKPFRFLTEERIQSRKRHRSAEQKYVSSAEYMEKFQKTTPPRFRTKVPYDIANGNNSNTRDYRTEITLAKTPNLVSRLRSRPVTAISKDEREERELEDMKKHQFKARPINPEIFRSGGECGVRRVAIQPVTKAVSPCLTTKGRFSAKRGREEMEKEEEKREFKAMPMPRAIFDAVTGVPDKKQHPVTAPLSPALSFKRRKLNDEEKPIDTKDAPSSQIKPLPMPKFSNVFKPVMAHTHTEVQPFSFEHKYPKKDEVINELVKKDEDEAAKKRDFHANPTPGHLDFPAPLPPKVHLPNTEAKPFTMNIDERIEQRIKTFEQKILLEREGERKQHEFHASETKASLYSAPFEPVKSDKPLTETSKVTLHTTLRSDDRSKFDEDRRKREYERQLEEENRKALRETEELERIKTLRKSLVHKALPIHDYPPVNIKPCSKPVTKPLSPHLILKSRTRTAAAASTNQS